MKKSIEKAYSCPMCSNGSILREIPRRVGGKVVECTICGHLTLWPQPDEEVVNSLYQKSAYVVTEDVGNAVLDNMAFKLLKKSDSRKTLSVLDVGCGLGEFVKICSREKHKVVGIEITKEIVEHLNREGYEVYQKTLNELGKTQPSCDWVACLNVLEHVNNPLSAIKTLADLVKPKGYLAIEVPNGDAIAKYGENAYGLHVDKEHLNYFRADQLIRILNKHGFRLVFKKYYPTACFIGRARTKRKSSCSDSCPKKGDESRYTYRTIKKATGIRAVVESMPPQLRGILRSMVQLTRFAVAYDEIITGRAHEFIIVMERN